MTKTATTLMDKYLQLQGRVFMSSNQALVRLPLDQARRDRAAGLKTAGYISGYRGSPLGVYDAALWGAQSLLDEHDITFRPGLNEELAVSAIRGTQELKWFGNSDFEGVFGLWYGKGIGVDRACEALKLGNLEGAAATGGFLAVAGDDHGGKSSDSAHQSEHTLVAAMLPVLYPATIAEIIEFGLFGWAMSRFSGCYVGLKCVTDTLDLTGTVTLPDMHRTFMAPPDIALPPEGLNLRPNLPPLVEEQWLVEKRLPAATAFARANGIDRMAIDGDQRNLTIVSAGKAYLDVREALADLGLDAAACARLGIRLYKPGLVWPLDSQGLAEVARGSNAVLVVEEKRPLIEEQAARALYDLPQHERPRLAGKRDLAGAALLPSVGELTAGAVRAAVVTLLQQLGTGDAEVERRGAEFDTLAQRAAQFDGGRIRPAYFCSGCPHNTSTRIPEDSIALGGIGCHGLAAVVMERDTLQFMPMGHEGSPWNAVGPFVDREHVFQNMGDGTYSHSGVLAIRAAVAANANITYKLLYNDAVAMTGGQPVEQQISPVEMVRQLLSEGVRCVCLVSDEPGKYRASALPAGASLHHRDELDALQRSLREREGVTAIVYEQTCAAEKRRRRKRGLLDDPDRRLYINPAVCEGCGDCSVQSNCLSVTPLETEFGRKRRIDQSSCNKDYSCLKGFCPSFVEVTGGTIATQQDDDNAALAGLLAALPDCPVAALPDAGYNMLVAGVGGTGVLTIGALLGMAAHLDGRACSVLDMTGMAQKGGSVTSHLRIAPVQETLHSARLDTGKTDLLLAADLIVGAGAPVLGTVRPGHTAAVLNTDVLPTGEFQSNKTVDLGAARLRETIARALDGGAVHELDASDLAARLTGDSIRGNILLLGCAAQQGLLPLSLASVEEAIRLNGAFVERNLHAFALGRLAAHDPAGLAAAIGPHAEPPAPLDTVEDVLASRSALLVEYQDDAWARRYVDFVTDIHARVATHSLADGDTFAREVALSLGKLMAYKDEYEVARLYSHPDFMAGLRAQFAGDIKLTFNLAPPALPGTDASGRPKKRRFGSWMLPAFGLLRHGKRLRGTALDPFGYFKERRVERALIEDYRALVLDVVARLDENNLATGVALAAAAQDIAGYGPVKHASIEAYRERVAQLRAAFDAPPRVADDGPDIVRSVQV